MRATGPIDREKPLPALRAATTTAAIATATAAAGTLLRLVYAQGTSAEVFSVEVLNRARGIRA
jgi:hypothetical protein